MPGTGLVFKIRGEKLANSGSFEQPELYFKKTNPVVICIALTSNTYRITAIFKCDGEQPSPGRGLRGRAWKGFCPTERGL